MGILKITTSCSVPRISETVSILNYLPLGFTLNCRSKGTKNISLRLVKMQKISACLILAGLFFVLTIHRKIRKSSVSLI